MNSSISCEYNNSATFKCAETLVQRLMSLASFRVSIILALLFAIPAVFLNCIYIHLLFRVTVIQPHAKILLLNTSAAALLLCFVDIGVMSSYLSKISSRNVVPVSHNDCVKQNILTVISSNSLSFSMIFLALERSFATKFFRSYELRSFLPSVFLVLTSWGLPILLHLSAVFQTSSDYHEPICTSVLSYPSRFTLVILTINVVLAFACISAFVLILRINRMKLLILSCNEAQLNLSDRFQLRNNIEISSSVLPAAVGQLAALFCTKGAFLYVITDPKFLPVTYKILIILFAKAIFSCNLLILPLSMILTNARLRKTFFLLLRTVQPAENGLRIGPVLELSPPPLTSLGAPINIPTDLTMVDIKISELMQNEMIRKNTIKSNGPWLL